MARKYSGRKTFVNEQNPALAKKFAHNTILGFRQLCELLVLGRVLIPIYFYTKKNQIATDTQLSVA